MILACMVVFMFRMVMATPNTKLRYISLTGFNDRSGACVHGGGCSNLVVTVNCVDHF